MASLSRGLTSVKRLIAVSRYVAIHAQSWVTANLFGPQGVVTPIPPDTTTVLREPVVTNRPLRPALQTVAVAGSLLLTTLAAAAPAETPFSLANATFPDRFAATSRLAAMQPAQPARFSLDTLALTPFVAIHHPDAPRGPSAWRDHQTITRFGPDTLALSPFIQKDWTAPTRNRSVTEGWTGKKTDESVVAAPFVQQSQPDSHTRPRTQLPDTQQNWVVHQPIPPVVAQSPEPPRGPTRWRDHSTVVRLGLDTLGQNPFVPEDWAAPSRARQVVEGFVGNKTADAAVVGDPFFQTDWANPIRGPLKPHRPTVVRSSFGDVAQAAPFTQTNWTNPVIAPRQTEGFIGKNTNEVVAAGPPFVQTNWSNPNRRLRPPHQPTIVRSSFGPVVDVTVRPFAQTDWPTPLPQRPAVQQRTARVLEPWPFNQWDWPNPLPAQKFHQDWTWSLDFSTLIQPNPKPFLQVDWQNPTRAKRPAVQDWVQPLNYERLGLWEFKSFSQHEWPNPTLAQRPAVQDWVQPLNYERFIQPNPKPFAQSAWTNPVVPRPQAHNAWVQPINYNAFIQPNPKPFLQADWQNPILARWPMANGWVHPLHYAAFVVPPVEPPVEPPAEPPTDPPQLTDYDGPYPLFTGNRDSPHVLGYFLRKKR